MGSYTAEKVFNFEFDGDQISCTMRSPSVATIKQIAPLMQQGEADGKGDVKFQMSMEDSMIFMEKVEPFLKDHISSFSGITDVEGSEVSLDTVLGTFYFLNLVSILISKLFIMGEVSEDEVKK